MKKKLLVIMGLGALLSMVATPAYADSYDLIPANDGGGCNASVSINVRALASDVYVMRASGGADCPGAGVTNVKVCVLKQQANGDYEEAGGACGAGASQGRATASAEIVCEGGTNYRGSIVATQGTTIGKNRTQPINCPPILPLP
jgi:hypothetical protein